MLFESDVFTGKSANATGIESVPGAGAFPSGATRYLSNGAAIATGRELKNHTTSPTRAMLNLMGDIPPPNINWEKVKETLRDAIS